MDGFARFAKSAVLITAAIQLMTSQTYLQHRGLLQFEYPVLILLATLGMLVMISANDLIALYMGLELQSLSLYVIAAFNRDSARSSEAGLKYFVLGALSSGMLLYGASLVYGYAGHDPAYPDIARRRRRWIAWPALRPGVPDRGACVQGLCRAVPHVDAGRVRRLAHAGHRVLCATAPKVAGDGAVRAGHA
jgi:NADH:ubiquinone oxidoreductase subunit 5 (subunit L)/multisubunit Na+/H+ antiporter MnhA subunit